MDDPLQRDFVQTFLDLRERVLLTVPSVSTTSTAKGKVNLISHSVHFLVRARQYFAPGYCFYIGLLKYYYWLTFSKNGWILLVLHLSCPNLWTWPALWFVIELWHASRVSYPYCDSFVFSIFFQKKNENLFLMGIDVRSFQYSKQFLKTECFQF